MERPTTLKIMTHVMDAVAYLRESKGSTARGILEFIRKNSSTSNKTLTMQVHKALRNAVKAGLLRHRNGRYKALTILNPIATEAREDGQNPSSAPEVTRSEDQSEVKSETNRKPRIPRQKNVLKRKKNDKRLKGRPKSRRGRPRRQRRRDIGHDLKRKRRRRRIGSFNDTPSRPVSKRIDDSVDMKLSPRIDRERSKSRSIRSVSRSNFSSSASDSDEENETSQIYNVKRAPPDLSRVRSKRSVFQNRPAQKFQQQSHGGESRGEKRLENKEGSVTECDDGPMKTKIAQHSIEDPDQSGSGSTL